MTYRLVPPRSRARKVLSVCMSDDGTGEISEAYPVSEPSGTELTNVGLGVLVGVWSAVMTSAYIIAMD